MVGEQVPPSGITICTRVVFTIQLAPGVELLVMSTMPKSVRIPVGQTTLTRRQD